MFQWYITNSNEFTTIEKNKDYLYFLEDTREIFKGDKCYTDSIFFVNDLPNLAIKDKLYINSTTLETSIWDGTKWRTIIPKIDVSLEDGVKSTGLVSGDAIKTYVSERLIDFEKHFNKEQGQISTNDIVLGKDIKINVDMGGFKAGDIIKKGTTLTDVLTKQMIIKELPEYIQPELFIRPDTKYVESGSILSLDISADFVKGDAGELISYLLEKIDGDNTTTVISDAKIKDYKEPPYMVADGDNLSYKATIKYNEGPIKNDTVGEPDIIHRIKAGTLTSSMSVIGQRNAFYGTLTKEFIKDPRVLTSNDIRSLNYNLINPVKGQRFDFEILKGTSQIVFAYPSKLGEITSIFSKVLNMNVLTAFDLMKIKVEGANKYNPIEYNVYIYTPKISYVNNDEYVFII